MSPPVQPSKSYVTEDSEVTSELTQKENAFWSNISVCHGLKGREQSEVFARPDLDPSVCLHTNLFKALKQAAMVAAYTQRW